MTECVLNLDLFAIMSGLMLPSHPPDQPDLCAEGAGARSALWRAPFSKVEGLTANMSFVKVSVIVELPLTKYSQRCSETKAFVKFTLRSSAAHEAAAASSNAPAQKFNFD